MTLYIGIDIAKTKFDVAVWDEGQRWERETYAQTTSGIAACVTWLQGLGAPGSVVCLEATGTYADAVAVALHEAGYRVSLLNPAVLKSFRQSLLVRTKNDRVDAALLARFGAMQHPARWEPPAGESREIQALARRLESLQTMRQQEVNRLENTRSAVVTASIEIMVTLFDQEIARVTTLIEQHIQAHPTLHTQHELLRSIQGIGAKTATGILAECGDLRQFAGAREVAAYAGGTPKEHTSGSSVHGKPRFSKVGSARLRKLLYFPAIVAKKHNPIVRDFCAQLTKRGKHPMTVIGAAMRKRLHIAYGVVKSGKPFDPNFGKKDPIPA